MILFIIDMIILSYLFIGLLLWIIPSNSNAGYYSCGFEDYNFLFIFFWLPMLFSEKIQEVISK